MTTPRFFHALGHDVADKRIEILRGVAATGSISQAARDAGVSYKAAWQAIDTLTNLAGLPLLERTVGGSGGGGARVTPAGDQLLAAAEAMDAARQSVTRRLGVSAVAGLQLRTSMRNQLPCTVQRLRSSGRVVRVELALPGDARWVSRITRESVELLGLAPGMPVLALCKATAVAVRPPAAQDRADAGGLNQLSGTADRITRGRSGDEITVSLSGGLQCVGFGEPGAGVRRGGAVWAEIDESAVVIALAG